MTGVPKKAFLLAAGHGVRLRPLTDTTPKCLLPIRGVPLLDIWLHRCREIGVAEVLINLHSHANEVRNFLRDRSWGVQVCVSDEPELLGSAGTIRENEEWLGGDRNFWIFYADVLTNANLNEMLRFHRRQLAAVTIGVYNVPDPS